jgi:hypothetical protein
MHAAIASCCIVGLQPARRPAIRVFWFFRAFCRFEIGDTAGWETCATVAKHIPYKFVFETRSYGNFRRRRINGARSRTAMITIRVGFIREVALSSKIRKLGFGCCTICDPLGVIAATI